MKEKKILMVCLGNICRSPLAEGILTEKCKHLPIFVDSAGTSGLHIGQTPDHRAQYIANENQINIANQKARKLTSRDIETFDLIYVMDESNYKNSLKLAKSKKHKIKIDFILNASNPGKNLNVPDPYFDSNEGFKNVFNLLNDSCEKIKIKLEKEYNAQR